jgi:protein gp37
MSDLFHPEVPLDFIREVFVVIDETPQHTYQLLTKRSKRLVNVCEELNWPENLWIGVTVESARYQFRIDHLRRVPGAVRFLSLEPLLGPLPTLDLHGISWVIVGGESGNGFRSIDEAWVREIRDQCVRSEVSFFFKQWGGRTPKAMGREFEGQTWDALPDSVYA